MMQELNEQMMQARNFREKMHEKYDFNEKERVKETYSSQKTKTL